MSVSLKRRLSPVQRKRLFAIAPEIPEGPHQNPILFFSGWSRTQIAMQASFLTLDDLPKPVRRRLHELTVTFDPVPLGRWWKQNVGKAPYKRRLSYILASIRDAESADLREFAYRYRARYGMSLPHVAAGATIMRYARSATR